MIKQKTWLIFTLTKVLESPYFRHDFASNIITGDIDVYNLLSDSR
jgi:hypothetical protein